jgi:SAM-dependent methyltransferase
METDYFEGLAAVEDNHWWHSSRRRIVLDQIERLYAGRRDLRILDVGCGTGRLLRELGRFGSAQGIDVSDEALRFCRQAGLEGVVKASLEQLPFPDGEFDLVTALDVIEHIDDHVAALRECRRVLRPDGRIVIFVPAHRWLWSLQDEISHHYRRYTASTLREALLSAGFQVERLTYVNLFLLPVIYVGRLWLKVLLRFKDLRSENELHPGWSNGLLARIFSSEIPILRSRDLPMGASLLCLAVPGPESGRRPARQLEKPLSAAGRTF